MGPLNGLNLHRMTWQVHLRGVLSVAEVAAAQVSGHSPCVNDLGLWLNQAAFERARGPAPALVDPEAGPGLVATRSNISGEPIREPARLALVADVTCCTPLSISRRFTAGEGLYLS